MQHVLLNSEIVPGKIRKSDFIFAVPTQLRGPCLFSHSSELLYPLPSLDVKGSQTLTIIPLLKCVFLSTLINLITLNNNTKFA